MPSLDFVQFVILILPGFLGLSFYRPFVWGGREDEQETFDVIKAALLGIPGYVAAVTYGGPLYIQVAISCCVAVAAGCIWGWIRRKFGAFEYGPARWHSKKTHRPIVTEHTDSVAHAYDAYFKTSRDKDYRMVAIVYEMSNPTFEYAGEVTYVCKDGTELTLNTSPVITRADLNSNIARIKEWIKIVNLDKGFVTEIVLVEKDFLDELYSAQ